MFLLRSQPTTNHPGPTLNALTPAASDPAQRAVRRIAMCQRLADLGLEYAEAAQREGVRDLQPRPERVLAPHAYMPPSPPHIPNPQFAETFATLCRCVRQAVLLQARLENEATDRPHVARPTPAEPAPRKSPEDPGASQPGDGTGLEYERLEDDLAADANRPADEILAEIREKLGQAIETLPAPIQASHTPHASTPRRAGFNPPPRERAMCASRPPGKPPPKKSG